MSIGQVVTAPPATPPTQGLVVSAASPPAGEGDAWLRGLSYRPESCAGYRLLGACDTTDPGAAVPGDVSVVDYLPPTVEVLRTCTTMQGAAETDEVRRQLAALAPYAIAHELWTGELATVESWPNLFLAAADSAAAPLTVVGGGAALAPALALGLVLEALGVCGHGQRGMIHVPRRAAVAWHNDVDRTGNIATVRSTDDLFVVDAGYPGTEPDGEAAPSATEAWIYATLMVTVRQGPDWVPADGAETVRTSVNRRILRGQRPFAATFDPCCRIAALVDLTAA